MRKLKLTKAWISLCSLILVSYAAAELPPPHRNGQPHHGTSTSRQKHQNTVPLGIQIREHVLSTRDVSCISADKNIFEIMNKASKTCRGQDMLCTFYYYANHQYQNIGTLEIDKKLFDNLLMKYDNWMLTAEKIANDIEPCDDGNRADCRVDKENKRNEYDKDECSRFSSKAKGGVHINDDNVYELDGNDNQHVANPRENHSRNHHSKVNNVKSTNDSRKKWVNENFIEIDPEYNKEHGYFEVILPKDKQNGKPRTIYVDMNKDKSEFVLFDEDINNKLDHFKPVKIQLEEFLTSDTVNDDQKDIDEPIILKENIQDNNLNYDQNVITSNINTKSIENENDTNLDIEEFVFNSNISDDTTENAKTIDNTEKNIIVPNEYKNQAQFYEESELNIPTDNIQINDIELLESNDTVPDVNEDSICEEASLDDVEYSDNFENTKLDLNNTDSSLFEVTENDELNENEYETYELFRDSENVTLDDGSHIIELVENTSIHNDMDLEDFHDFSCTQSSNTKQLNEPIYQLKKPFRENDLKTTPYITEPVRVPDGSHLDSISSHHKPLSHDIPLSSYHPIPLLGKKLAEALEANSQLQPGFSSSLPAYATVDLHPDASDNTAFNAEFEHPLTASNICQYTSPILPSPSAESAGKLNSGSEFINIKPSSASLTETPLRPEVINPSCLIQPILQSQPPSQLTNLMDLGLVKNTPLICSGRPLPIYNQNNIITPILANRFRDPYITLPQYIPCLEPLLPVNPSSRISNVVTLDSPSSLEETNPLSAGDSSRGVQPITLLPFVSNTPLSQINSLLQWPGILTNTCPNLMNNVPHYQIPSLSHDVSSDKKISTVDNTTPCVDRILEPIPLSDIEQTDSDSLLEITSSSYEPLPSVYKMPVQKDVTSSLTLEQDLTSLPVQYKPVEKEFSDEYSKTISSNVVLDSFLIDSDLPTLSSTNFLITDENRIINEESRLAGDLTHLIPLDSSLIGPELDSNNSQSNTLLTQSEITSTQVEIETLKNKSSIILDASLIGPHLPILSPNDTLISDDYNIYEELPVEYDHDNFIPLDASLIGPHLSISAGNSDENQTIYEELEPDITGFIPLESSLIDTEVDLSELEELNITEYNNSDQSLSAIPSPKLYETIKSIPTNLTEELPIESDFNLIPLDSSLIGAHLVIKDSPSITDSIEDKTIPIVVLEENLKNADVRVTESLQSNILPSSLTPPSLNLQTHADLDLTPMPYDPELNKKLDKLSIETNVSQNLIKSVPELLQSQLVEPVDLTDTSSIESLTTDSSVHHAVLTSLFDTPYIEANLLSIAEPIPKLPSHINKTVPLLSKDSTTSQDEIESVEMSVLESKSLLDSSLLGPSLVQKIDSLEVTPISYSESELDSSLIGPSLYQEIKSAENSSALESVSLPNSSLIGPSLLQEIGSADLSLVSDASSFLETSLIGLSLTEEVESAEMSTILDSESRLDSSLIGPGLLEVSKSNSSGYEEIQGIYEELSPKEDLTNFIPLDSSLIDAQEEIESQLERSVVPELSLSSASLEFSPSDFKEKELLLESTVSSIQASKSRIPATQISTESNFLPVSPSLLPPTSSSPCPSLFGDNLPLLHVPELQETELLPCDLISNSNNIPYTSNTKLQALSTSYLSPLSNFNTLLTAPLSLLDKAQIPISHLSPCLPINPILDPRQQLQPHSNIQNLQGQTGIPGVNTMTIAHTPFMFNPLRIDNSKLSSNTSLLQSKICNSEYKPIVIDNIMSLLDEESPLPKDISYLPLSQYSTVPTNSEFDTGKSVSESSTLSANQQQNHAVIQTNPVCTTPLLDSGISKTAKPLHTLPSLLTLLKPKLPISTSILHNIPQYYIPELLLPVESILPLEEVTMIPSKPHSALYPCKNTTISSTIPHNNILDNNFLQTAPYELQNTLSPTSSEANSLPETCTPQILPSDVLETLASKIDQETTASLGIAPILNPDYIKTRTVLPVPITNPMDLPSVNPQNFIPFISQRPICSQFNLRPYSNVPLDAQFSEMIEPAQLPKSSQASLPPDPSTVKNYSEITQPCFLPLPLDGATLVPPISTYLPANVGYSRNIPQIVTKPLKPEYNILPPCLTPILEAKLLHTSPRNNQQTSPVFTELLHNLEYITPTKLQLHKIPQSIKSETIPRINTEYILSEPCLESPTFVPSLSVLNEPYYAAPCQLPPLTSAYITPLSNEITTPILPTYSHPKSVSNTKPISTLNAMPLSSYPCSVIPFSPDFSSPLIPLKSVPLSEYPVYTRPLSSAVPCKPSQAYSRPYLPVHHSPFSIETSPAYLGKTEAMMNSQSPAYSLPISAPYLSPVPKELPAVSGPLTPISTNPMTPIDCYSPLQTPINTLTGPSNMLSPPYISPILNQHTLAPFNRSHLPYYIPLPSANLKQKITSSHAPLQLLTPLNLLPVSNAINPSTTYQGLPIKPSKLLSSPDSKSPININNLKKNIPYDKILESNLQSSDSTEFTEKLTSYDKENICTYSDDIDEAFYEELSLGHPLESLSYTLAPEATTEPLRDYELIQQEDLNPSSFAHSLTTEPTLLSNLYQKPHKPLYSAPSIPFSSIIKTNPQTVLENMPLIPLPNTLKSVLSSPLLKPLSPVTPALIDKKICSEQLPYNILPMYDILQSVPYYPIPSTKMSKTPITSPYMQYVPKTPSPIDMSTYKNILPSQATPESSPVPVSPLSVVPIEYYTTPISGFKPISLSKSLPTTVPNILENYIPLSPIYTGLISNTAPIHGSLIKPSTALNAPDVTPIEYIPLTANAPVPQYITPISPAQSLKNIKPISLQVLPTNLQDISYLQCLPMEEAPYLHEYVPPLARKIVPKIPTSPLPNIDYSINTPLIAKPALVDNILPESTTGFYQTEPLPIVKTVSPYSELSPVPCKYAVPSSSYLPLDTSIVTGTTPNQLKDPHYGLPSAPIYSGSIPSLPLRRNPIIIDADAKASPGKPLYSTLTNLRSSQTLIPSDSILLSNILRPLDISKDYSDPYSSPITASAPLYSSSISKPSANILPPKSRPIDNIPQILPATSSLLKSPLLKPLLTTSNNKASPLIMRYSNLTPSKSLTKHEYLGPSDSFIAESPEILQPISLLSATPCSLLKSPFTKQNQSPIPALAIEPGVITRSQSSSLLNPISVTPLSSVPSTEAELLSPSQILQYLPRPAVLRPPNKKTPWLKISKLFSQIPPHFSNVLSQKRTPIPVAADIPSNDMPLYSQYDIMESSSSLFEETAKLVVVAATSASESSSDTIELTEPFELIPDIDDTFMTLELKQQRQFSPVFTSKYVPMSKPTHTISPLPIKKSESLMVRDDAQLIDSADYIPISSIISASDSQLVNDISPINTLRFTPSRVSSLQSDLLELLPYTLLDSNVHKKAVNKKIPSNLPTYSNLVPQPSPLYLRPQEYSDLISSTTIPLTPPDVDSQIVTEPTLAETSPVLSPKPFTSPLYFSPKLKPHNWFQSPIFAKYLPLHEKPIEIIPETVNPGLFNKYRPNVAPIPVSNLPYELQSSISEVPLELYSVKPVKPKPLLKLETQNKEYYDKTNEYDREMTPDVLETENYSLHEASPNILEASKVSVPNLNEAQRPKSLSKLDNFYANNHIGKSPQVYTVPTYNTKSTGSQSVVKRPCITVNPEICKDFNTIPGKHFGVIPKLDTTSLKSNEYFTKISSIPTKIPTIMKSYPCFESSSQIKLPPNTMEVYQTSELPYPISYTPSDNIGDIKYAGYKTYHIPSFKFPKMRITPQNYSPTKVTSPSLNNQQMHEIPCPPYRPTVIPEPLIPQYQKPMTMITPLQTKLDLNSIQQSPNLNEYEPIEDIAVCVDNINENNELKTSLVNYINKNERVKDDLYNNDAEITIPLGNIAITKKEPCNAETIETNNPSIGLKVWKSNIKELQAELKLKFKDISVNNFMPIINNLNKYDVEEIRKIVKNYIDEKYGNHIEVNELYAFDNQYTVIKDLKHNAVDSKFNLLWPTNYV